MGDKEHNGKRFGFIRNLFEKKNSAAEEVNEEVAVEQEQTPQAQEEYAARRDAAQLSIGTGALQELWRKWTGRSDPLTLSLLGDGRSVEPPLTERELIAERLRLSAKIERDAKTHMSAINRYEEKKMRLNARRALMQSLNEKRSDDERKLSEKAGDELQDVDPFCGLYMSANGMTAWLLMLPSNNRSIHPKKVDIDLLVAEHKISHGLDAASVEYALQTHPYFTLIPIACGTPVQEGENGQVIEHYPRQLSRSVKLDSDGVADYRALNYIQGIHEGDVICDIVPPKPGVPGKRVDGAVAEPRAVKSATVPAGKYTKISEDGTQLLAEKTGHLEYEGSKFFIKILLDVPGDVDYSTGNLEYDGDVHIHGDVRATFAVKASGNVIIDGLVEAARVEAGGDVLVSCGILGDGNAEIMCGGNLRAKYLESCTAYVGKSAYADCIMSSQVYCDDSIETLTGRGAIIGGFLVAGNKIKTKIVGTDSGRKTELELGTLTYNRMIRSEEIAELKTTMNELTRLDRDIAFLEKKQKLQEKQNDGGDQEVEQRLATALLRRSAVCARMDELTKIQQEIEEMKPDLAKCRFESGTVYPPTMLTIGGAIWKFEEIKNNCAGWLDKVVGEINIT